MSVPGIAFAVLCCATLTAEAAGDPRMAVDLSHGWRFRQTDEARDVPRREGRSKPSTVPSKPPAGTTAC